MGAVRPNQMHSDPSLYPNHSVMKSTWKLGNSKIQYLNENKFLFNLSPAVSQAPKISLAR